MGQSAGRAAAGQQGDPPLGRLLHLLHPSGAADFFFLSNCAKKKKKCLQVVGKTLAACSGRKFVSF